ncbi:MAG: glycosyltransferase, partial [Saprospiraceae bacterium]|nr:glycosyltransferase [Saprospiraceae bacterium]
MKWLPGCLNAVTNQSAKPESIILVDNGSEDESVRWVSTNYSEVSIIKLDKNFGFARAVNAGIEKARTKYVALLNTDTVVDPNWLIYLWEILEQGSEKIGAVTPLMLSMQNPEIIDDAGDDLSWYGEASKSGHGLRVDGQIFSKEVFSPCAGAALYRRGF